MDLKSKPLRRHQPAGLGSGRAHVTPMSSPPYERVDPTPADGCCQRLLDVIRGTTPEEIRKRKFQRHHLPLLKAGSSFRLVSLARSAETSGSFFSGVTSLFGGTSRGKREAKEVMVWVQLSADRDGIDWHTLAQRKGTPEREGTLELDKIVRVDDSDENPSCVRFIGAKDRPLLEIAAESELECERWVVAVQEAKFALEGESKAGRSVKQGKRRLEARRIEMERRKREADAYKASLGDIGMVQTARIMMERDSR